MGAAAERPAWVDERLFPFRSRFEEIDGNTVHYVDEGDGPTLLMLHGNPTWSFLFRHLISGLRDRFRCVALDYPGFGLSTARVGYGFRPAEHAGVVEAFVRKLDLRDVTLFVQDWGGPIGLWTASREPERFRALVIGNTWAWPIEDDPRYRWFSKLMSGPVGRLRFRGANLFVNVFVPQGHGRRKLTRREMDHYRGPFPTRASLRPTTVFPRELVASTPFLREIEAGLPRLARLPVLIVWGDADVAFRAKERARFEALFPNHTTRVLAAVRHYLWDDAPGTILEAFLAWWPEATRDAE